MDSAGHLRTDIQQALQRQRLTTWQRNFLTAIHSRLERSQGQARLSDKQWKSSSKSSGDKATQTVRRHRKYLGVRSSALTKHEASLPSEAKHPKPVFTGEFRYRLPTKSGSTHSLEQVRHSTDILNLARHRGAVKI